MSIPYTDTIFLGIIRMLLWILFLYILKRLFFKGKPSQNQVKTMGGLWALYGSVVLVVIFFLVQINSYDLLTILALMIVFLSMRLVGFDNLRFKGESWFRKRQSILISVIENIEDEDPIINIQSKTTKKRFSVKAGFVIASLVGILAMLVRFYLMQYDNYQLSPGWFLEHSILIGISDQHWFNDDMVLAGQYALMSFYSLITGISPEMALESFALFQVFILCFVMFWFIDAITNSLVTIPLLGALIFALFFNLAPINLARLTHSKSTFMALTFLLPAITFIRRPWKLYKQRPKIYFFGMVSIFGAIALIDIFTLLILLPPYFLVEMPFQKKENRNFFLQAISAYLLSTSLAMAYYLYATYLRGINFGLFIRTNLLSITSTTTTGDMVLDYDTTVLTYQIVCMVGVLIMAFLSRKNKRKWVAPIVFILYTNVLVLISQSGFRYFDNDLLNEISPVLLACSLSFIFYIFFYFLNTKLRRVEIPNRLSAPFIIVIFFLVAFYTQRDLSNRTIKSASISKNILEAYQLVKDDYIPYGYAIVNANDLLPFSKGSHIFLSYDEFVNAYPARDSIYFENKDDEAFLRSNTEFIIPNSLLVFIYEDVTKEFAAKITIDPAMNEKVLDEIEMLRGRGREVRLFYTKGSVRIYEIVNNPRAAKIEELL